MIPILQSMKTKPSRIDCVCLDTTLGRHRHRVPPYPPTRTAFSIRAQADVDAIPKHIADALAVTCPSYLAMSDRSGSQTRTRTLRVWVLVRQQSWRPRTKVNVELPTSVSVPNTVRTNTCSTLSRTCTSCVLDCTARILGFRYAGGHVTALLMSLVLYCTSTVLAR
jgi:hypothetical protein